MLFFFFFKQKAPLVSSLASQLSALENKQPSTVHRLEKLEPASLQVLHEGDTALSAASSQLAITPPSSSAYAGGVGRAQQDGWSGRQVGGELWHQKLPLPLSLSPQSCLVETKRTEINCRYIS